MRISLMCQAFFGSLLIFFSNANAQNNNVQFYDVITDDSVVMFFNTGYRFCEKECLDFKRYTKVNDNGDFNGDFVDSTLSGNILAKGHYDKGIKNGWFQISIPDQYLHFTGSFKENLPIGLWQYYYADGRPERKIAISTSDTLLIDFFDEKGNQLVKDGNGFFKGRVHVYGSGLYNRVIASGKIVNGKAMGRWTSTISGVAYNSEELDDGVLISGITARQKPVSYFDYSMITNFILETHLEKLEEFHISDFCPGKNTSFSAAKSLKPVNLNNFYSFINAEVNRITQYDIEKENFDNYPVGENRLVVRFKVNDKGIPDNIRRISNWGDQFFDVIARNLRSHVIFNTFGEELYFHLVINRNPGQIIGYRYNFSRNSTQ